MTHDSDQLNKGLNNVVTTLLRRNKGMYSQEDVEKIVAEKVEGAKRDGVIESANKVYQVYDAKYSHPTRDYRTEDAFRDDVYEAIMSIINPKKENLCPNCKNGTIPNPSRWGDIGNSICSVCGKENL